ncbi:meprin A subunit beta [Oryzias melastigma]|uniref:meprin A subunit beta n=1 Tax=Oryzias melastigma TaxID=30732 RepID=UPI00168CBA50|nr:meprin A subunit beta [Oryzias melastigma]
MEMKVFLLVLLKLAISITGFSPIEVEIIDLTDETKVNNDSLHDDILELPFQRSTLIGNDETRWTSPVPYVLNKSLDLNAKGIILRALDQFRLKSCIDFKPRDAEVYYISIEKLDGCYSYVGRRVKNGQVLSIGADCDSIAVVEHEILHALGFFHEQSRYDRDDFVTIVWDNIISGKEHNFDKVGSDVSTTHGTPYDYMSVMHYNKDAFNNGNGSTIITKDPKFQNVIGQRLEMSYYDVQELNRLYNCNSTIAFNMYCGFSNGTMCRMDRCSKGNINWEVVTQVSGGPNSDHTTLPSGSKNYSGEVGYFMHVSTATGQEGDTAQLETQRMTPKRDCHIQCLQFYYYHSGNESDVLNIWIREFENEQDSTGTRRLIGQITGSQTSHWRLHHVSLNASKSFQVVFEAQKGAGLSTGGFSVDDINLYETECPHLPLQIDDFERVLKTSVSGSRIYSSRQYSSEGYAYRFAVIFYKTYFGLFVQLLSGDYDGQLEWPCLGRQIFFQMLDQTPNIQQQMSKRSSFTTSGNDPSARWNNPRETGTQQFVDENNQAVYGGPLIGFGSFAILEKTQDGEFLKGGSAVFALNFQDLNPLLNGSSLACPQVRPINFTPYPTNDDGRPCSWTTSSAQFPMTTPSSTNGPFVHNSTKYPSTSPNPTDKVDDRTTSNTLLPITTPPSTNGPYVHSTTKFPSTPRNPTDDRTTQRTPFPMTTPPTQPNPTDNFYDGTTSSTTFPMTAPPGTSGPFEHKTTKNPLTSPNPTDEVHDGTTSSTTFPMTAPPGTSGPLVHKTTRNPLTSPNPTDEVHDGTTPGTPFPMTTPPPTNGPFVHNTTKLSSSSPNPTDEVDDRTTPRTKFPMTRPPVTNGSFVHNTTEYSSTSPSRPDRDDDSIFCHSPDMIPSVTIIFLLVLMILAP